MITPKLTEYIQKQHSIGTSKETIKSILLKAGWNIKDIDLAFKQITPQPSANQKTNIPEKNKKSFVLQYGYYFLIAILLVIILTTGGFFLYQKLTQNYRNLSEIAQKFSLTKDFEIKGDINLTYKDLEAFKLASFNQLRKEVIDSTNFDYGIIKGNFHAQTDTNSKDHPDDPSGFNNRREKLFADIEIETHFKNTKDIFSRQNYSFEILNINQSTYFKLTQFDGFENPELLNLRNQWIKFDPKILRAALNIPTKNDLNGNEPPSEGSSFEKTQVIRQIIANNPVFDLDYLDPKPAFINDFEANHYHLKINQQRVESLFGQLNQLFADDELAQSILNLSHSYILEFTDASFEVATDKTTNLPYRLIITLSPGSSPNESKLESAFLEISLDHYRKTFPAQAPDNYIDLTHPDTSTRSAQTPEPNP